MIEVLSLVNFDQPARIAYLEKSFGSFHSFNPGVRHIVIDGSRRIEEQKAIYESLGVEYYHRPIPYCARLKAGLSMLTQDYFVFLPDDYVWIFSFPLESAINECRRYAIDELKLACRGMRWFASKNPKPEPWFEGARVISGELLMPQGDLFVSRRRWLRDFHEQFSLGCHLLSTGFARKVVYPLSDDIPSPGAVEKRTYLHLYLRGNPYLTAYYKMWIPAFHFIDVSVEGEHNRHKAEDMLIDENYDLYNNLFNR